jgi:hypothetical protein
MQNKGKFSHFAGVTFHHLGAIAFAVEAFFDVPPLQIRGSV